MLEQDLQPIDDFTEGAASLLEGEQVSDTMSLGGDARQHMDITFTTHAIRSNNLNVIIIMQVQTLTQA